MGRQVQGTPAAVCLSVPNGCQDGIDQRRPQPRGHRQAITGDDAQGRHQCSQIVRVLVTTLQSLQRQVPARDDRPVMTHRLLTCLDIHCLPKQLRRIGVGARAVRMSAFSGISLGAEARQQAPSRSQTAGSGAGWPLKRRFPYLDRDRLAYILRLAR
jgi:hypothetical protein